MQQSQLLIQLSGAINLVSMMPPSKLKKNLAGLVQIAPEIQDNLYEKVLLPMGTQLLDKEINTQGSSPFLQTEFNRDGDCYRSPFENVYYPENEPSAYFPTENYREFERVGNMLFQQYTKLYYGNEGVGSFYVLETDSNPNKFSCGYFAKKSKIIDKSGIQNTEGFEGDWNSFNIVDIEIKGHTAVYNLESTVLLEMKIAKPQGGNLQLTGFMKNSKKVQNSLQDTKAEQVMSVHLSTVGQLIQTLETTIRQQMQAIYIAKTREIVFTTRYEQSRQIEKNRYKLAQDLKAIRFSKE